MQGIGYGSYPSRGLGVEVEDSYGAYVITLDYPTIRKILMDMEMRGSLLYRVEVSKPVPMRARGYKQDMIYVDEAGMVGVFPGEIKAVKVHECDASDCATSELDFYSSVLDYHIAADPERVKRERAKFPECSNLKCLIGRLST